MLPVLHSSTIGTLSAIVIFLCNEITYLSWCNNDWGMMKFFFDLTTLWLRVCDTFTNLSQIFSWICDMCQFSNKWSSAQNLVCCNCSDSLVNKLAMLSALGMYVIEMSSSSTQCHIKWCQTSIYASWTKWPARSLSWIEYYGQPWGKCFRDFILWGSYSLSL